MIKYIKKLYQEKKLRKKEKKLQNLYNSYFTLYNIIKKANILLIYLEEIGIKNIDYTEYNIIITYNDSTIATLWNLNRWSCWMSYGDIKFSNGEVMSWEKYQPSKETLYKYKMFVENYEKKIREKEEEEEENINKYLPVKLLRKRKLNNLKNTNEHF